MTPIINLYNEDCIPAMKKMADNQYDLAIVDPPYGIGFSNYERGSSGIKVKERYTKNGKKEWDKIVPTDEYFKQLFRVSKYQIIWGGNYFNLSPTKHFIFWYKRNPVPNFADGEYAWTNFDMPAKCFDYTYYGNINTETNRIVPTQKPIALYKWLLKNYAKEGDKILDTHFGSLSIGIACHDYGYDLTAYEIDKDYFEAGKKRLEIHKKRPQGFFKEKELQHDKKNTKPLF